MFSGTSADFGRTERSASTVFVRTRLNSVYQSIIVNFPGAESPKCSSSHCFASTVFFPIKKQRLINTRNSFLSIVLKMTKVASPKPLSLLNLTSDWHETLTVNVWRLILSIKYMDLRTVVSSICQTRNLLSDVLQGPFVGKGQVSNA